MGKRRTWKPQEKLAIIKEALEQGVEKTIRKHEISIATYYNWKNNYEQQGEDGLKLKYQRVDPELKRLRNENQRLKQIVADKELELQIKEALLKKSHQRKRSD